MDDLTFLSAFVALAGAGLAGFLGYWAQQRLRRIDQRNLMDAYGASLAWAAFDLQSRLFNVLHGHVTDRAPGRGQGFLTAFLTHGSPQDAEFVRRSTVFVLAEYLGWVEIMRRDVQFLDLGRSGTNRAVMVGISDIAAALNTVSRPGGNELRLFRAQQRAIGELMIHAGDEPGRRRCLGYAEFCGRLDADEQFLAWFGPLLDDVDRLAAGAGAAVPRLREVQNKLVVLLDILDPRAERFPHFRAVFPSA
jgi:hypothetical protein